MLRYLASLCAFALLVNQSFAQQTPGVRLTLCDGSLLRGTIASETIALQTAYGQLTIPVSELRSIQFGLHLTDTEAKQINDAVRGLGSVVHKEREQSTKLLKSMGRKAVPALHARGIAYEKNLPDKDYEAAVRTMTVLHDIFEADPAAEKITDRDKVETKDFTAVGKIVTDGLAIKSKTLGELTVKLHDMKHLFVAGVGYHSTKLHAELFKNPEDWWDVGVEVRDTDKLTITAKGNVDLWPQGPGQYMAQPKGYNTAGKGGQFMAGALIAKIGENGRPFFVGERFESPVNQAGRVYLMIVLSPWNNVSAGGYDVTVNVGE